MTPVPKQVNPRGRPAQMTPAERGLAKSLVAKYDRMGLSQRAVAARAGADLGRYVSQPTARELILEVREAYVRATETEAKLARAEKLDQLRAARAEAWAAWEASKGNQPGTGNVGTGPGRIKSQRVTTASRRDPDTAYLLTVLRALDAECKLLGLYPDRNEKEKPAPGAGSADVWRGLVSAPAEAGTAALA